LNLKHYLDPQDKGWISPCDLFGVLCNIVFWGIVAFVYFFVCLELAAPFMDTMYHTKELDYIHVMPWYGWIIAPLIGVSITALSIIVVLLFCKLVYYLEENNYSCPNFGIRKRLCKIKLWKFR
jgi:hypothetical protein